MAGNQPSQVVSPIQEEEVLQAPTIPPMSVPQEVPNRTPAMGAAPLQDQAVQPSAAPVPEVDAGPDFSAFMDIPVNDQFTAPSIEGGSPGASLWSQFKASAGRTDEEKASIFENHYGKGNARVNGDVIEFRNPGEKKFRKVRADDLDMLSSLFEAGVANAGAIAEGAVATGAELLGGMLGSAAAPVAGTVAGAAALGAAGGAAGAAAREGAVKMFGGQVDPTVSLGEEMLVGAGTGAAFGGAAKIAGKLVEKIAAKSIDPNLKIIGEVADVKDDMRAFYNAFGIKDVPKSEVGQRIASRINLERKALGTQVGEVRQAAYKLAGDKRFKPNEFISETDKFLKSKASVGDIKFDESSIPIGGGASTTVPKAIVSDNASPVTKFIANHYNDLNKNIESGNGLPLPVLEETMTKLKPLANFKNPLPTADEAMAQQLYKSLKTDRDAAFVAALDGTPEGEVFVKSFREYQQKIDPARAFVRTFDKLAKDGKSEKIVNAVVQKNASGKIRQFKDLVDAADSPETMDMLRGEFLRDQFEKTVNPNTGIPNTRAFMKNVNSYGKETLNELFSPEQMGEVRKLAVRMNNINTKSITELDNTLKMMSESPTIRANLTQWVKNLVKSTKGNAQASEYLLDEGISKLPISATDRMSLIQQIVTDDDVQKTLGAKVIRGASRAIRNQSSRFTDNTITESNRENRGRSPDSIDMPSMVSDPDDMEAIKRARRGESNPTMQRDVPDAGQESFDSSSRERFQRNARTNRSPDSIDMAPMTQLDTRQSTDRLLQRMRQLERSGDPRDELPRIRATLRNRGIRATQ